MREKRPGVWELRVHLGRKADGTVRQKSRSLHGTKRQAERALAKLVAEVDGGAFGATPGSFGYLLDEWMTIVDRDRSPTTAEGYRSKIETWLRPALGAVPLDDITARQLDTLYSTMMAKGKSPATVRQVHAIAHRALAQAVKWDWIDANPATKASPPSVPRSEAEPPPVDHLAAALRAYVEVNPDMATLWWVSASLGSRRGEAVGLQWRDLDTDRGTILVRRSVVELKGRWLVKDTKTHASRRVRLDEGTLAILAAHRARCEERAAAALVELRDDAFMFSPEPGGIAPYLPGRVTKTWRRWADANGLEGARLHDLRHLAASVLLAAGVQLHTVSRRLGHARTSTTLDIYGHVMPGTDDVAAEVMGRALGEGGGVSRPGVA